MKLIGGRQVIGWGTALFTAGMLTPFVWQMAAASGLIAAFLLVWAYAPQVVDRAADRLPPEWQLDRKLGRLATAMDGPASQHDQRLGRLTELRDIGTEILKRRVNFPDLYAKWKRDLDTWVAATSTFLEQEFGKAAREMFMALEPAPAQRMPGALNPDHARDLRDLMNRLRRLTVITKRYGS